MARFKGTEGNVSFTVSEGPGPAYDLHVVSFDISDEVTIGRYVDADVVDAQAPASGQGAYEETTAGNKRWSGTFTCHADDGASLPGPGALGSATFITKTGRIWAGQIRIESVEESIELESEDLVQTVFSFQGHGAPTSRP